MNVDKIRDALKRLSPREGEVMNHVVSGLLNKEVAAELGITERTVKQHRACVMAKMGAKTFAELIAMVLTIQFNGKHEEANMQSMLSLENADALKIMADVLQTSPESFLEHLVFWHCQRQIEIRGIEYFAETIRLDLSIQSSSAKSRRQVRGTSRSGQSGEQHWRGVSLFVRSASPVSCALR